MAGTCQKHRKWIFVLSLIFLGFLFIPIDSQIRNLAPTGVEGQLTGQDLTPVNLNAIHQFTLPIGGDISLLGRPLLLSDLTASESIDKFRKAALEEDRNHRIVNDLSFSFVTYGQRLNPNCKIILMLSPEQQSDEMDCSRWQDNSLANFKFKSRILPGIFHATFQWKEGVLGNLGIYSWQGTDGQKWLHPFTQKPQLSIFKLLVDWHKYAPFRSTLYLLIILISFVLSLVMKPSGFSLIAVALALYLCGMTMAPNYSGHDETAHLTMLNEVLHPNSDEKIFNNEAAHDIISADFYRLNNAIVIKPDQCPHFVLGNGCGVTERPKNLYSFYSTVLTTFNLNKFSAPTDLLWIGKTFNFICLMFLIIFVYLFFGECALPGLSVILILLGAYLSQFTTLSNDPIMFQFAILSATGVGALLTRSLKRNTIIAFGSVLVLLILILKNFDRSYIAAVPILVSYPALAFISKRNNYSAKNRTLPAVIVFLATVTIGWLGFIQTPLLKHILNQSYFIKLVTIFEDLEFIKNIQKFNITSGIHATWIWWKSLAGSFIWGHTYYPSAYVIAVTVFYVFLAFKAFQYLSSQFGEVLSSFITFLFGICVLGQLMAILSAVLVSLEDNVVSVEAFLKARMTGPSLTVFLFRTFIGFNSIWKNQTARIYIQRAVTIWTLFIAVYLFPIVFLRDVY